MRVRTDYYSPSGTSLRWLGRSYTCWTIRKRDGHWARQQERNFQRNLPLLFLNGTCCRSFSRSVRRYHPISKTNPQHFMCGIAGFVNFEDAGDLAEMALKEQAHRGPDSRHVWSADNITLVHL